MFEKWKAKKEIERLKKEILQVESRMHRSHSACIQALLEGKPMPEEDVKYHKQYMDQIDELRSKIHALENQLKG